jgi:hypothetical protein
MTHIKFFKQYRKSRAKGSDEVYAYICAHWRTIGEDGKSKQAGCSISAERHGELDALTMAMRRSNVAYGVSYASTILAAINKHGHYCV